MKSVSNNVITELKIPRIYIVLLNWNGWKDTIECLESVLRITHSNYQIVVCDNASKDQSLTKIRNWAVGEIAVEIAREHPLHHLSYPNVPKPIDFVELTREQAEAPRSQPFTSPLVLIQTGANHGFAGGNNVGLRYVIQQGDADYIWLLNNDTVVEQDALSALLKKCETESTSDTPYTSGSLVCFYTEPHIVQALGGNRFNFWTGIASITLGRFKSRNDDFDHKATANSINYITGCSWLLPISFIKKIGLMEEKYFLYYEEIDWVTRAKNDFGITYAADSIVYHKEGSSIGSKTLARGPSVLSEYYMARSKLLFMRNFFPLRAPLVYALSVLQGINRFKQGLPANGFAILRAIFGLPRN